MARVRYSLEQAQAEAIRRAEVYLADRADRDQWKLYGAVTDTFVPSSHASKHPVAWVVIYSPVPPVGSVIDGGELFVAVNLDLGTIGLRPW